MCHGAVDRLHLVRGMSGNMLVFGTGKRSLHIWGAMQIRERAFSQPPTFLKHIRERQRKLPSRVNFSKRPAEDRGGKDKSLVGVDPAGGGKHGSLCLLSGIAESLKKLCFRFVGMLPAQTEKFPKPWDQGGAAVKEGEEIHIFVGAGIVPIYKSRFRCDGYLIEKSPNCSGCRHIGCPITEKFVKELCRLPSDQFHGVGLLRGADMGIFTADKAGSRKKTEIVTLYGNSARPHTSRLKRRPRGWLSSMETRNFLTDTAGDFKRKNA